MTPERWRQIQETFQAALDLAPAARSDYLERTCAGDPALRLEVESLLNADAGAQSRIEAAVVDAAAVLRGAPLGASGAYSEVGRRIGPYQIIDEIGSGGMGRVYRAVRADDQYLHVVAIKLLRRGLDSSSVLSRFRSERQILANLQHPNIAALLDGGTTEDGRPYFVMEFIEGRRITEYCELQKPPVASRLELFRAVCAAVHHAHQRMVIHRDIKPGNILVTAEGVPKLLDFGIAKLLAPELVVGLEATQSADRLMTPDYASPEQLRGEEVTAATDIYSLGVLLHELLTGQRPDQSDPSQRAHLAGDLNNIIAMAIRQEPRHRYGSVEQFSEDILRYLTARPVLASKDTLGYRIEKFARRNKLAVGAGVLVSLSLVGGMAATTYQARRAERRFGELRKFANAMLFEAHDKIQNLPGSTEARELLVKRSIEYLDALARDTGDDPSLELELARAYERIGNVQGSPFYPNLGQTAAALVSHQKSLAIAQRLAAANPSHEVLKFLASAHYNVSDFELQAGETAKAKASVRKGLDILESAGAKQPGNADYYALVASGLNRLGDADARIGDLTRALESYRAGIDVCQRWITEQPGDTAQVALGRSTFRVGRTLTRTGDLSGALNIFRQAVAAREAHAAKRPGNPIPLRDLVLAYHWAAEVAGNPYAINLGDAALALDYYRKALAVAVGLAASDSNNARARLDLSTSYANLGMMLAESDPRRAVELEQKALEISSELLSADAANNDLRRQHALAIVVRADALRVLKDRAGALRGLREAVEIGRAVAAADPVRSQARLDLAATHRRIGDLLLEAGDRLGAGRSYAEALSFAEGVSAGAVDIYVWRERADTYEALAKFQSTPAAACSWRRKCLETWTEWERRAGASPYSAPRKAAADRAVASCDAIRP